MTTTIETLDWAPPGPGSWTIAADHYPRAVTPTAAALLPVWSEVTTQYMTRIGLPIKSATMAAVNGLPYMSVDAGGGGSRTPPPWLMRLLAAVVPSLRRAEKQLASHIEQRPWRGAITDWFERDRAIAVRRLADLTAIDPLGLGASELADHLIVVRSELEASMRQHLAMHEFDTMPVGLFVVRAQRWGLTRDDALSVVAGESPASAGDSEELDALRAAVAGSTVTSIAEIRALGPAASAALDDFLVIHGWRVLDGYDVDCKALAESPELVVRLANHPPRPRRSDELAGAVESARTRISAEHRAEFDEMLHDARRVCGLRDDNSGILLAWPVGLMRRAMLAAGHALGLDDPDLAVEASADELDTALRGGTPLSSAELAGRAVRRRSVLAADAPRTLGPPEPPPPEGLPGALGEVLALFELFAYGEPTPDRPPLTGFGIGDHVYEGRVRRVLGADATAGDFEPGEVLVAPMTSPSYNVLLSLAGALVTEEGGAISHAAIMARELGLPAVIGCPSATNELADGDVVRVDPVAGRVTVVTRTDRGIR